jgi:hypothetical protein
VPIDDRFKLHSQSASLICLTHRRTRAQLDCAPVILSVRGHVEGRRRMLLLWSFSLLPRSKKLATTGVGRSNSTTYTTNFENLLRFGKALYKIFWPRW